MNREEILAKGRAENKNKDLYEQEILKQASRIAVMVQMILAAVFFLTQIFVDKGTNWGLWALILSTSMTVNWVKYSKLHHRQELVTAIAYTILVVIMSGYHIYTLVAPAAIL